MNPPAWHVAACQLWCKPRSHPNVLPDLTTYSGRVTACRMQFTDDYRGSWQCGSMDAFEAELPVYLAELASLVGPLPVVVTSVAA